MSKKDVISIMANFPPFPQLPAESSGKKPIHYRLTFDEWCSFAKQLKPAELKVLYYLRTLDPSGERSLEVRITDIADEMGLNKGTVSRALKVLARTNNTDIGHFKFYTQDNPEQRVRDRLHQLLGGLVEVETAVGRIDILTNDQVIEVKHVKDWKAALGQVLAYGAFYPEHQKRIHLFGDCPTQKREVLQSTCEGMGVVVTMEGGL